MAQPEQNPVADIYRLAEALNLPLSPGDRQVLEALLRSQPHGISGTTQAVIDQAREQTRQLIDQERTRANEVLDQAKASENALKQSAAQREALIQQWLKAQQAQPQAPGVSTDVKTLIQTEVKAAIDEQLNGLIAKIEAALGQPGGSGNGG
ncbi:hypothetical protein [Pseudomonas sp. SDO5271_S396]